MSDAKTLRLKVVGDHSMHCAGCERSIEFTLSQFPGVQNVKADWKTQEIRVNTISEELDLEKVKTELEWIGYEVEAA